MLASGWKLVAETLLELAEAGLLDYKIKNQLKTDPNIRLRYLNLYDMVKELVELNQTKVSVLATTTRKDVCAWRNLHSDPMLVPQLIITNISKKQEQAILTRRIMFLIGLLYATLGDPSSTRL